MPSITEISLREARTYLKRFVILSRGSVPPHGDLVEQLHEALPSSHSSKIVSSDQHIVVVRDYILHLFLKVHEGAGQSTERNTSIAGTVDHQAMDFLTQVLLGSVVSPFLSEGLGSSIHRDKSLEELSQAPICDASELYDILERLVLMFGRPSLLSSALRKIPHTALIVAGLLQHDYSSSSSKGLDLLDLLLNCLSPLRQLQVWQILGSQNCPVWARKIIQSHRTQILIQPTGFQNVSAYVLQPDANNQVSSERIELLANLTSAVPAEVTASDYLQLLVPQVLEALNDSTPDGALRKRASVQVLRKLLNIYNEASYIKENLWASLQSDAATSSESAKQSSLERLCTLSAYADLRPNVFSKTLPLMVRLSYVAVTLRNEAQAAAFERLIYRWLEMPGASEELTESLRHLMEYKLPIHDSAVDEKSKCVSRLDYFRRILDQNKGDGSILVSFLFELYDNYRQLAASPGPLEHAKLFSIQLELLSQLPANHAILVYSPTYLLSWLHKISSSLNVVVNSQESSTASAESLILLSWLNNLLNVKPVLESTHFQICDELDADLEVIISLSKEDSIRKSATDLKLKLGLSVLQARTSEIAVATNSLALQPKYTVDMELAQKRYKAALQDLGDDMVPNRAHGLYLIGDLAGTTASKDIIDIKKISPIILGLLAEEEPFVYHNAIKAMKKLLVAFDYEYRTILEDARASEIYALPTRERIEQVLLDVDSTDTK